MLNWQLATPQKSPLKSSNESNPHSKKPNIMELKKSQIGKPHGSLGRMAPLIVMALVILGLVYLFLNPAPFINLMKYAQATSQGKTMAQANAEASASASASAAASAVGELKTPDDFLNLMKVNASTLSDTNKKILNIFSDELDRITKTKEKETVESNSEVTSIFQPLAQAKTDEDLAKIRDAAAQLKQTAENAVGVFQGVQPELAKRLADIGVADPLNTQVAEAFATQGNVPDDLKTAQNMSKFADATAAYVDFLKESKNTWTRKPDGALSFHSKDAATKAQQLGKAFSDAAVAAGYQMK
jgi:hypothetical protein